MSAARETTWRWFPRGLIGALVVVALVNGYMVWTALHTFPGQAGEDGFDLSNGYNRILVGSARQAALGWTIRAEADAAGHPALRVTGPNGAMLSGATIEARAERPLGPRMPTTLTLQPDGDRMIASETLAPGQWALFVQVRRGDDAASVTERIVVR
jgi:nitrogen fixation protein FixH